MNYHPDSKTANFSIAVSFNNHLALPQNPLILSTLQAYA